MSDRRRFSTIDNQAYRVAEIIGDGRIYGWEITESTPPAVIVTEGGGIIDGYYVNTFDDQSFTLQDNSTSYVFVQRKVGIIGTEGPRSDVAHAQYIDAGAPGNPSNLSLSHTQSNTRYKFNIELTWTGVSDFDLDEYVISRSKDGADFETIGSTEDTTYLDEVDEYSSYDYRIFAVDLSGNYSSGSADSSISVGLTDYLPLNPIEVEMHESEGAINVLWKRPPAMDFDIIDYWLITYSELDTDNSIIDQSEVTVNKDLYYERINNLSTGRTYRVTLQTVDYVGRKSIGVSLNVVPQPSPAPRDPYGIAYTFDVGEFGVLIDFSWASGDSEYDPAVSYRYKIYPRIGDSPEALSIDVPPNTTSEQISLYTLNGSQYSSIPENTLVTFRFTALDSNGFESRGSYVRFVTARFALPKSLYNIEAEYNLDSGNLIITWDNQDDTESILIRITEEDLNEDSYTSVVEIVNENIGFTNKYVYENAEQNKKYSAYLTPLNSDSVEGYESIVVETTLGIASLPLPDAPNNITAQPSDKQILLTWDNSTTDYTRLYHIYRKVGPITLDAEDWSLLDTMPSNINRFVDYGLINDQSYSYYITSEDVYGRESETLSDESVNLNFVNATPLSQGVLTEPDNVVATINNNEIKITWDALVEEFDSFSIHRSINNLHSWETIGNVKRDVFEFIDNSFPLVDGTIIYYTVDKAINDAAIIVQTMPSSPPNSICLGIVTLSDGIVNIDSDCRRDIKDLSDPLAEYTFQYLLNHRHREVEILDPERIDLSPELLVKDWRTVDGKIWFTEQDISDGTYIVKVNDRYPNVFFEVDGNSGRIVFSEPIDQESNIEVRVLGIEEVQNVLDSYRFDRIHAKQVQFGELNIEQLPELNHDGRIKEQLFANRYLLERYDSHNFIIPQSNTDSTKNFGDGTVFYTVIDSDGRIKEIIDFDLYDDGLQVGFRNPSYSTETIANLKQSSLSSSQLASGSVANDYEILDNTLFCFTNSDEHVLKAYDYSGDTFYSIQSMPNLTSGNDKRNIAVDLLNDKMYVGTYEDGISYINEIDIATGRVLWSHAVTNNSTGLAFLGYNADLDVFYTKDSDNELHYFSADNGWESSPFSAAISAPDIDLTYLNLYDHFTDTSTAADINPGIFIYSANFAYRIRLPVGNEYPVVTGIASNSSHFQSYTYDKDVAGGRLIGSKVSGSDTELIGARYNIADRIATETAITTVAGETFTGFTKINDDNWWKSDPDTLKIGHFGGVISSFYVRFPINVPIENSLATAAISLVGSHSSGNSISTKISLLDPREYSDDIELTDDIIKTVSVLTNMTTSLSPIADGDSISIDILSLVSDFVTSEYYTPGRHAIFRFEVLGTPNALDYREYYSYNSTQHAPALDVTYVVDLAEVSSDPGGFQSVKAYRFQWEFADNEYYRWVKISTNGLDLKPNPVIDLNKRLRFKYKLNSGSMFIGFGIREITSTTLNTGDDGGTVGPIEWVNVSEVLSGPSGTLVPIGSTTLLASDNWTEIDIDLQKVKALSYSNGNGQLGRNLGVLEHLFLTINPDDPPVGPVELLIDKLEQIDDLMVSGTSQGILTSGDFGANWKQARLTDSPVHKFYRATNNRFLWAISANEVLFSVDPEFWFSAGGLSGVQFIKDIAEDSEGNMYASTDRGVYFMEIALITRSANFQQTIPVNAFTTDCYGLWHYHASSGQDEIWVSTEIGIYKTSDHGETWEDSGMDTAGLVAYSFINIGSVTTPVLIAITRKYILRKLVSDQTFRTIANLEEQHGIFDIWKAAYFNGKLYVATGSGLYVNKEDLLFSSESIDVTFVASYAGLSRGDDRLVALGLDVIQVDDDNYQLFVGQEDRLMMINNDGILSTKREFRNKELPSFYVNNNEITTGHIYNSFNGIVSFREPRSITDVVYASHLPRKTFFAVNGGWATTNPSAEIFLYKNGVPTWLYFRINEASVSSELQLIQSRLTGITLNTFNSLYPDSENYRNTTLQSILTILGSSESPGVIDNNTIIDFLNKYTRFLSLITNQLKTTSGLNDPSIVISGIRRADGDPSSRAALLEEKEGFESEESFGITINAYSGEVDFLSAFTNTTDLSERAKLSFSKYDRLEITAFNTQIAHSGEFTHTYLEDRLEDFNTGMSSQMGDVFNTNLIKLGIFLEQNHNHMFHRYNVSNVQSQFYSAHSNDWYDITNSTVDYDTFIDIPHHPESHIVYDSCLFDDPYFSGKIWIATDKDIIQFSIDTDGHLSVDDIVRPGSGIHPVSVTCIYVHRDRVYVVASESSGRSHLYYTDDYGVTWQELETINLPLEFEKFTIINNIKVVFTENGPYYNDNNFGTWYPSDIELSLTTPVAAESAIKQRVRQFYKDTFLILESDRYFYTSGSGIGFLGIGRVEQSTSVVNALYRFKNLLWIGTDHGLYNDGNSVLSDNIQFGLVNNIESTALESVNVVINDITSSEDALYCCSNSGKIYRFWDDPNDSLQASLWTSYKIPGFDAIQRIQYYVVDDREFLAVINFNKLVAVNITPGEGIFG